MNSIKSLLNPMSQREVEDFECNSKETDNSNQNQNNKNKIENQEIQVDISNKKRKLTIELPIYENIQKDYNLPNKPPIIEAEKFKDRLKKEDIERLTIKNTVLTDITPLLILPQKVAANKLDMSESMLCKKYKEITNKKWPYRQLRKIEREIAVTKSNKELKNTKR